VVGARLPRARSRRVASWRRIGATGISLGGGCAFGGDRGCRCASGDDREADAHPASLGEAEARPTSLSEADARPASLREADARPASLGEAAALPVSLGEADARPASMGRQMCVQRRLGKAERSGRSQRAGEQSATSQGWWAAASPARPALGFHRGGSASVGSERMDSFPIRSGGRAAVGSQWDLHGRHGQRDGNDLRGLHRCDFEIGRVKLSTLPNYG
jgi:hypothetical protein